jgi:Ran GTPase-activating protein (RanGAP) involved in mRNA processing and transport
MVKQLLLTLCLDLQGAKNVKLLENGEVQIDEISEGTNLIVDARKITVSNVAQSIASILKFSSQIYGINMSAAVLDEESVCIFVSSCLLSGKLEYLVDLDLSYTHFSYKGLYDFCKFANPVISGYNPLKRLSMNRCGLGINGTKLVIEAFAKNNFIEELYLSSNQATDHSCESLIRLLQYSESRLRALGFGDNLLSCEAVSKIADCFEAHNFLSTVQLHDNAIGDEGCGAVLRSVRDKHLMRSLNFRSCRLRSCPWAGVRLYFVLLSDNLTFITFNLNFY